MKWLNLTDEERQLVLQQAGTISGINIKALEKDCWVTILLKAIFQTPMAGHLLFKGGTSLSKSWKLVERFSEDIDLSIDRAFYGFGEELTITQIKKLKRTSSAFISTEFRAALEKELMNLGIPQGTITVTAKPIPEHMKDAVDPQEILVIYPSLLAPVEYLPDRVKVEVSVRSVKEPFSTRELDSLLDEIIPGQAFSGGAFPVRVIDPEITMLEKIFLMHEEFTKAKEHVRFLRMSRHLYDLSRLMQSEHAQKALHDQELYERLIAHRVHFIRQRGVDYSRHGRETIDFRLPEWIKADYENDYAQMREQMIYGKPPSFEQLMDAIEKLHADISGAFNNGVKW
ncbi:MAG: nucleotidyl transferase AbiEii/AbiGii toxin family protein [Sediminibacterium sp.]|nr:nucleotidyl transferase AbiEii/AbiGii toxin family protein [Sediminibacterium sp.]